MDLLNAMLQTDPKRRITVQQLLSHPWMMDGGFDKPVRWQSRYHSSETIDSDVVRELAAFRMAAPLKLADTLKKWDYSSPLTVTYFILLDRKQKGSNYTLTPAKSDILTESNNAMMTPKRNQNHTGDSPLKDSPRGLHNSLEGGLDDLDLLNMNSPTSMERGVKNRASERYHIPNKKRLEECSDNNKENAGSPLSPSRSVDSNINNINNINATPTNNKYPAAGKKSAANNRDWVFATPERPSPKSSKKVFGSIERGLDRFKNILTPKKHRNSSSGDPGPSLVTGKALCNVSTTSQHNPDAVLNDLSKALVAKGIACQQKGYTLRGKIRDSSGFAKLSFELEVCRIPHLNVVGIRRKRLKGDAWCYKKVCEEVLRLAAVGKA